MKYLVVLMLILICGCDDIRVIEHLQCRHGIVYIASGGIWIEAKFYSGNKCFSDKLDSKGKPIL